MSSAKLKSLIQNPALGRVFLIEKAEFQMGDLRTKARANKAKSSGNIMQAKDQLGRTTVVEREQYIQSQRQKSHAHKRIANRCQNCDPETNKGLHQLSPANP
jgi:hypothetical protein